MSRTRRGGAGTHLIRNGGDENGFGENGIVNGAGAKLGYDAVEVDGVKVGFEGRIIKAKEIVSGPSDQRVF